MAEGQWWRWLQERLDGVLSMALKLLLTYNVAIVIYVMTEAQQRPVMGHLFVWPPLNFQGVNSISSGV